MLDTILLVVAIVCFVAATIGVNARLNLTAAGLACWAATGLV